MRKSLFVFVAGIFFSACANNGSPSTPALQDGAAISLNFSVQNTAVAGNCFPVTIGVATSGNVALISDAQISLSGGDFFSDSGCQSSITQSTISAGSLSQVVYEQEKNAKIFSLAASLTQTPSISGQASITIQPAAASALNLNVPNPLSVGVCMPVVVKAQDGYGNDSPLSQNHQIDFSQNGNAVFFQDQNCTQPMTVNSGHVTATITSGSFSYTMYLLDLKLDNLSVTVSDEAGQLPSFSSASETIVPGPATQISYINAPTNFVVGQCTQLTVGLYDAGQNATNASADVLVNLSSTGSGMFYSSCTSSSPITSVTIPMGQQSVSFYINDVALEMLSLGLSLGNNTLSGVVSSASVSINVYSAANFLGVLPIPLVPGTPLPLNRCIPIEMRAEALGPGNSQPVPAVVQADLVGNLSVSSGSHLMFFSDPMSCLRGIQSFTIPRGMTNVTIYAKDNSPVPEAVSIMVQLVAYPNMSDGSAPLFFAPSH